MNSARSRANGNRAGLVLVVAGGAGQPGLHRPGHRVAGPGLADGDRVGAPGIWSPRRARRWTRPRPPARGGPAPGRPAPAGSAPRAGHRGGRSRSPCRVSRSAGPAGPARRELRSHQSPDDAVGDGQRPVQVTAASLAPPAGSAATQYAAQLADQLGFRRRDRGRPVGGDQVLGLCQRQVSLPVYRVADQRFERVLDPVLRVVDAGGAGLVRLRPQVQRGIRIAAELKGNQVVVLGG